MQQYCYVIFVDCFKLMIREKNLYHFHYFVSGALGKRTRFQEKDCSQLIVLVHKDESITGIPTGTVRHD